MNIKNYSIGEKVGRLTLLNDTHKRKNSYVVWNCQCECGNFIEKASNNLSYKNKVQECLECSTKTKTKYNTKHGGLSVEYERLYRIGRGS